MYVLYLAIAPKFSDDYVVVRFNYSCIQSLAPINYSYHEYGGLWVQVELYLTYLSAFDYWYLDANITFVDFFILLRICLLKCILIYN